MGVHYSAGLGLADKVGEQEHPLETLTCCSAELGGHKLLRMKFQALVTKPDCVSERQNPWECEESREERCRGDSEGGEMPRAVLTLNAKESESNSNASQCGSSTCGCS